MKLSRKIFMVLISGFLITALLMTTISGCAKPASEPGAKQLVIGSILPISGPISTVGIAMTRGLELYFDKVNEEGGINIGAEKYMIKFIPEDSKLSPEGASTAARKLVHQDGAKFVFGAVLEPATAAIADVTAAADVAHLIFTINIPGHPVDVGSEKPLTARLLISFDDTHTIGFDYLKEAYPNVKTVAISAPDIGYEGMIEDAIFTAEARGFKVVHVQKWPFETEDFIPIYTRLLAEKPDAIMAMISGQAHYQLMAARQLGFEGPFFSNAPTGPDVFLRVAGAEVSNDVFTNGLNPDDPTEVMQEVMERWQAKYKDDFISDSIAGWDEAWILVQAMEKAQSVDPQAVIAALDSMINMGDLQTSYGPGYMGGQERFGINRVLHRPIALTHIKNGEIKTVGYFYGTNR